MLKNTKHDRCLMTKQQAKAASKYIQLRKYGMPRWLATMISGI